MDCSAPGLPVPHHLLEFAQVRVHWIGDAIQLFYPVSPPSPPAFSLSQQQGLFQWVASSFFFFSFPVSCLFVSGGQSIGVSALASVLPMNIQGWFPLGFTGLIFLLSKGFSRVFSSITFQKRQFFGAQPSLQFSSHISHLLERLQNHCRWWLQPWI